MKGPVLCVCNYGLVRSRTMAARLTARGIEAQAAGLLNTPARIMDVLMARVETILICNKPDVEEWPLVNPIQLWQPSTDALKLIKKYRKKIVVCNTIGRDKWAKFNHPELVGICDEYLDKTLGR